ncbi:2-oxoglutarate synthase subunit alpha, partial [bacterium (candidate division B38) B3_B38]
QRGGPSTGLPTLVGQQDMMQARWGSHGDYEIIALCPSSPQELFDYTIKAFNLSEKYRVPVLVMGDEVVGHMSERVVIPSKEKIELFSRRKYTGPPEEYLPFKPDKNLVPPMVTAGEGYHIHITGLTHDEKGYPVINAEAQNELVPRLMNKIIKNADKIIEIEETNTKDAEVIIISYGISARTSLRAIELAEEEGIKVGILRLITVWPFPEKRIYQLASKVAGFVVPEINLGQIVYEVERCAKGKTRVTLVPHAGGHIHDPRDIFQAIRSTLK